MSDGAKITFAYAVARMGYTMCVVSVMTREQLLARQKAYANDEVAKVELEAVPWWPRKTAIRELCNLLPQSPRLALALRFEAETPGGDPAPPTSLSVNAGNVDDLTTADPARDARSDE